MAKKMVTGSEKSMSVAAVNVFSAQLRSKTPLPADLHRAVFTLASRAGHLELMTLLVAREDAPADLVERYRVITDIPVRVAFLTRPGHSEQFLKSEIASEKRAGVLAALVTSQNVTPAIVSLVSDVFSEKPTRALAEALAAASGLSAATRLTIFETLAPRFDRLTQPMQASVREISNVLADSELRDAAAVAARRPELAEPFLVRSGLSVEARLNVVEQAIVERMNVPHAKDRNGRRSWYGQRAAEAAITAIDRLLTCGDVQTEVFDRLREVVSDPASLFEPKEQKTLLARIDTRAGAVVPPEPFESLLDLAQKGDEDAQFRLVTDDSVEMKVRLEMVEKLRFGPRLADVVKKLPSEVVDAIFMREPDAVIRAGGFEAYADPEAAQVRLLGLASAAYKKSGRSNYYYGSPLYTLAQQPLCDAAVMALPWAFLQSITQNSYYMDQQLSHVLSRIGTLQAERFGPEIVLWETFGVLSDDFGGTVGELLDMVGLLVEE